MYEQVYGITPISVQNILISMYGYKLRTQRYGKYYFRKLRELRNRENIDIDYDSYQIKKLNEFVSYAKQHSEFYNKMLEEVSLPIESLSDLKDIPVLSKEELRRNMNKIITINKNRAIKSTTGGTTGKSLAIYFTKKDMQERMALLDYFKEKHGIKMGMKRASFTGKNLIPVHQNKKVYWRYNAALNQLLFSSFHATEENLKYYIEKLNRFKPVSLDGFPSVMLKIAKYALKNDIKFEFEPIAIFPTAETILETDRIILEKAFGCSVRNQYASSEGAPFITECPRGSLHLNIDTGVFEKNEEDNISEVIITSFTTHGTPLIRYKIGDSMEFTNEKCDCGFNTPIVRRILGRSMDYLYSPERGEISSANMSNVIKNIPNSIIGVQFIQDSERKIIINIVIDRQNFSEGHLAEIRKEMEHRFGTKMQFKINILDELPIESSGKTRFIINKILT